MKGRCLLKCLLLPFSIFILCNQSHARRIQPSLQPQNITTQIELRKSHKSLSVPTIIAGILCFVAGSISSAGGIGGGGLFVPVINIVAGLDLKTASIFSAFMVTAGSVANVLCNIYFKNPKYGGKVLTDYDIVLLSEPCMLLGVSVGVICNIVFPEWLITVLFAVFLAWTTSKTCKTGLLYWKLESEEAIGNGSEASRDGCVIEEACEGSPEIAWKKVGVLVMIWFSFFALQFIRGDKKRDDGKNIIQLEPYGNAYWIISASQVPLAIIFTAWILYQTSAQGHTSYKQIGVPIRSPCPSNLVFPVMALLAGILGGIFGIGGGMLVSPLLLQLGILPEVTAATCSFMVLFSSSMSATQYLLLGLEHRNEIAIFSIGSFLASLVGLLVVQRAIMKYGRASLIVFSISTVMVLSTVLITSFGTIHAWKDYTSGKYMGFKLPC
ncbi:PREDICTED: uncharacterized protein LOC104590170 isoform X2 [Nelumbo nucifera]|uniref:Uncharacterized protein LOC104590170 isoform X2 n=1 Tax=Nelumbo nucifera TaxID=4432 RepID=A0A1U7ZG13_NELNU|nr:PREDICTED: uncharacterized protein LOC104590170 isoform X2 [Nelumbo nucifera]